jgi:hypothetical protein
MSREIILIIAAVILLAVILYSIGLARNLNVSKSFKLFLYFITLIVPVLGLYLVLKEKKRQAGRS